MRKRARYSHCGGRGTTRSRAMMPTNARNGAMYPTVARRRNSMGCCICDRGYDVSETLAMVTHRTERTGRSDAYLRRAGGRGVVAGSRVVARAEDSGRPDLGATLRSL